MGVSVSTKDDIQLGPSRSDAPCYDRFLHAHDGSILADRHHSECKWPVGAYVCGNDVCEGSAVQFVTSKPDHVHPVSMAATKVSQANTREPGILPVRRGYLLADQSNAEPSEIPAV